jgi:membrane protease YdiL (CAAX protease family)
MIPEFFHNPWFIILLIFLALWSGIWKIIGLWRSARNNELAWFICIAVFNTLGILPIIYILMDKKKKPGVLE